MGITLKDYQRARQEYLASKIPPRELCYVCWRPLGFCYCHRVKKTTLPYRFVILIHPIEEKRPIATGRMAHLCLENSILIEGDDFTSHAEVNALLADPQYFPVVLYPGPASKDLSTMTAAERRCFFPMDKTPLIFVIDGTWNSARKTMWVSRNLRALPSFRFTPSTPSRIRVRHQPHKHYYTTLEAIHQTIELLGPPESRSHDNLLDVLDYMVSLQLNFAGEGKRRDAGLRRRRIIPCDEPRERF